MQRREFLHFCAAGAAATAASGDALAAADAKPHFYTRTKLLEAAGRPMLAAQVPAHRTLVFHYPYDTTPCFLLNLGRPIEGSAKLRTADARTYDWKGGVGRSRSIVAYSAICAHQLAYPTRQISFISYRTERSQRNRHANVIHCCAEHSQYDPAQGAKVVAGPAPQPLAAILLEHDAASDELYAVGTLGGEMFEKFFEKYAMRLQLEHGSAARKAVGASAVVTELDAYCRQQVKC
ncbi:MAG TPA: (2Fe-2S)-binding protein [Burkholderiales bacterium]|nr:(2Fe-2S)-binding protein [Burkholderiales bacterium]